MRYTNGRFAPEGLVREVIVLREPPPEAPRALPELARRDARHPALLLVIDEDMHRKSVFPDPVAFKAAIIAADPDCCGEKCPPVRPSPRQRMRQSRVASYFDCPVDLADCLDAETLVEAAEAAG